MLFLSFALLLVTSCSFEKESEGFDKARWIYASYATSLSGKNYLIGYDTITPSSNSNERVTLKSNVIKYYSILDKDTVDTYRFSESEKSYTVPLVLKFEDGSSIFDRLVSYSEKQESIEVNEREYNCYLFESPALKSRDGHSLYERRVDCYSPEIGLVESRTYDKNGQLSYKRLLLEHHR